LCKYNWDFVPSPASRRDIVGIRPQLATPILPPAAHIWDAVQSRIDGQEINQIEDLAYTSKSIQAATVNKN
jgi:hypothetical protein